MESRDLTYFLQVASARHVRRAAEALGLTQPALTKSIARLERELEARLFDRTPKGVSLTPLGQLLVKHATRLQLDMDEAKRELGDLSAGETGILRIGSGVSLAQHLLPTACTILLDDYPRISLDITTGTGQRLIAALRDGSLDLVVSGVRENPDSDLRHEVIMEDEVMVIARYGHPLHRCRRMTLEELAKQHWVLSKSGSLLSNWLIDHYRQTGLIPPVATVETDSLSTQLSIVSGSDLLCFQSWTSIRHSPLHKSIRPLASAPLVWRRRIGITYRDRGYYPKAAYRLIEILKSMCLRQPRRRTSEIRPAGGVAASPGITRTSRRTR